MKPVVHLFAPLDYAVRLGAAGLTQPGGCAFHCARLARMCGAIIVEPAD